MLGAEKWAAINESRATLADTREESTTKAPLDQNKSSFEKRRGSFERKQSSFLLTRRSSSKDITSGKAVPFASIIDIR